MGQTSSFAQAKNGSELPVDVCKLHLGYGLVRSRDVLATLQSWIDNTRKSTFKSDAMGWRQLNLGFDGRFLSIAMVMVACTPLAASVTTWGVSMLLERQRRSSLGLSAAKTGR